MIDLRTRFEVVNRALQVLRALDDLIPLRAAARLGPAGIPLECAFYFGVQHRAAALNEEVDVI